MIECKDFTTEESCFEYQPISSINKCIFKGGKCEQELKSCGNGNSGKEVCESITGYENGKFGTCSYDPKKTPKCGFTKFSNCERYTGDSEYICNNIDSATKYYKCVMKDNKCTSEPIEITSCEIMLVKLIK